MNDLLNHKSTSSFISLNKVFLLFFLALFLFLLGGSTVSLGVLVGCIFYSMTGVDAAIKSLTISLVIFLLNPALFGFSTELVTVLRMFLFIVSSTSIVLHSVSKLRVPKFLKELFFLIGFIFLCSLFSSYYLKVSLFKLLLFSFGSVGILVGFYNSRKTREYWIEWFVSLWGAIVLLSIPLLFISSIGFAQNNRGFQGLVNHPQTFGVILCPVLAMLLGLFFFDRYRLSKSVLILVLICIVEIVLSQARTGLVATILSFLIIFFLSLFRNMKWKNILKNSFRNNKFILFYITLLFIGPLAIYLYWDEVFEYALKGRGKGDVGDSFYESRGFLLLIQINNIKDNLLTGIGFQLASIPSQLEVVVDPYLGLPVKASIEKGNIFTAVVEENGIIGAFAFLVFILKYFKGISKNYNFGMLWAALTALLINIGEATFFSFSGIGLFTWLILGLATVKLR